MSLTTALAISILWWAMAAFMLLRLKLPRPLPTEPSAGPFVSVIVPARNESQNIRRCVSSLCASQYEGGFEVIVVDDRSDDDTAEVAESVARGRADKVRVVRGAELPSDWTGKPWACHQGVEAARGSLLLFTDADTWHAPELLGRAVAGMEEDGADLLSLAGDQETGSFWERVAQPSFLFLLVQVYPNTSLPFRQSRWRKAVANGQFIFVRRKVYESIGGHRATSAAVIEDLRLAHIMTRAGHTVVLRRAKAAFATRMYRSLGEIVRGWSKNIAMGARMFAGEAVGMFLPPVLLTTVATIFLLPFWALLAGAVAGAGAPFLLGAGSATLANMATAAQVNRSSDVSPLYGLLQPLSAMVVCCAVLHSWVRGRRISWKGRVYTARTVG